MVFPTGGTQFLNGVQIEPAVLGGSGRVYFEPQQAIDSEVDTVFAGLSAAGTTNGTVVGPAGFPATNDALNGFDIVLTDVSPTRGLSAIARKVSDYVGATRTMTIDGTEDYGIGENIAAISPAKVTMLRAFQRDLTITKNLVLDGSGNVLDGRIDIGAGATYVEIKDLEILDGLFITTSTSSIIRLENVIVHARETFAYAISRSDASTVGRFEAKGLQTYGVVSFKQPRGAYILSDCIFGNVNAGTGAVSGNNLVRLWDADGAALTAVDGLVTMQNCSNPGSIFSSSGAAGNLTFSGWFKADLDMRCIITGDPTNTVPADDFNFGFASGGSTFSFAPTAGSINIKLPINADNSLLRCESFTGTATMNFSNVGFVEIDGANANQVFFVRFTGSAFTGTATLTGSDTLGLICPEAAANIVMYEAPNCTGTCNVTNTGAINIQGANNITIVGFQANQTTAPGPTTAVSAALNFDDIPFGVFAVPAFVGVTDVDQGTTTISSLVTGNSLGGVHRLLATVFGGANVTISGIWRCAFAAGFDGIDGGLRIARHGGTAGTLTCSAAFFGQGPWFGNFPQMGHAIGAGATVVASGARTLSGMRFDTAFAFTFAATATSVVSGGGAITLENCVMQATGIEIADSDVAGASVTVPTGVTLRGCTFEGTFATRTDADGTYVGTCDLVMVNCEIFGAFTPHGTSFPNINAFECAFRGSPDALGFAATSQADPGTSFNFFKCSFPNGRYYVLNNSLTLGKPIIWDDEIVANSGAATTNEHLGKFDTTARLIDLANATDNVAGVFQGGGTGAAANAQRAIVHGFGFVVGDEAIQQGDALVPGAAVTASRVSPNATKRVGYALDAAAFPTGAGDRIYARIHVDR